MIRKELLLRLPAGGPERRALDAGEIDAIIDYSSSNVILLPAAQRALRRMAPRHATASLDPANEAIANGLLCGLPQSEYRLLAPWLEPYGLDVGAVLFEPGVPVRHVYFPVDCCVTLQVVAQDGRALTVGVVGHEGMLGLSLVLGATLPAARAVVQIAGTAMRMDAAPFLKAFGQSPSLQRSFYRYVHVKLTQAMQAVACHKFHAIEARLANCLLMASACVLHTEFALTQEVLAKMLGVRRGTVNEAAVPLQKSQLISYVRGRIRILDPQGLRAASCACCTTILLAASSPAAAGARFAN
jgi:CRP-like cAMP-binding protein